jgi:DNA polymerase-3 subunit gamma/tau
MAIVAQLELTGAARQLASHCVFLGRQGALVRLLLDPRHQLVRTTATEEKLAQALSRHFGTTVRLEFQSGTAQGTETPAQAQRRADEAELSAARRAFDEDPGVRGLRERFGASVLPDTVRPVK